jgi:Intracellular septation protein A.
MKFLLDFFPIALFFIVYKNDGLVRGYLRHDWRHCVANVNYTLSNG